MKEKNVTLYIAEDGKQFGSKEKCEEYERDYIYHDFNRMLGDMNYIYASADDVYPMGDYANGVLFIEIQNEKQADRFTKWITSYDEIPYIDTKGIVGEVLICDCYDGGEGTDEIESVYECITPNDMIKKFTDNVYYFINRLRENGESVK